MQVEYLDWPLVWSDEFSVDGLPDPAKWGYDTSRNKQGWHNGELQYYSSERLKNSRVEDGSCHRSTGVPEFASDWGGQSYTSARLVTSGKAAWTYGAFEIRAKLPCGRGVWPAIWMLSSKSSMRWPDDGAIDIMEHVGHDEGVVYASVHTADYNRLQNTQKTAQTRLSDLCQAFHRYQLIWTPYVVTIGVDDHNYFRFLNDGKRDKPSWPFNAPQFLLLNTAVGGTWGGMKGVDDSVFPVRMEVDYVRVWQAPK
ncbi:MAG: glycoside hydrolase family 16 protein [Uliginosibacterium sp.]|nr:glycoside hydrolase family 16 protein [Uliginosibacterium sp.]